MWIAAVALAALACGGERADSHLERAERHLSEGRSSEASIELRSALAADPESARANRMLGDLASASGRFSEATGYYREAVRLDPGDSQATVNLAGLLRASQPKQADALIAELVATKPNDRITWIGVTEQALALGDAAGAVEAASKAIELAPDDPRTHWEMGYVRRALVRDAAMRGQAPSETDLQSAAESLQRYLELGGDEPWTAQLELARLYALWPGHEQDASEAFRHAVEAAAGGANARVQADALRALVQFASQVRNPELHAWALERVVETRPESFDAWRALAQLRAGSAEEIYQRMLARLPESGDARVEYARHVLATRGFDAAVAFFEQEIERGVAPAHLLGALANLQYAARKPNQAAATIARLEREYPDDPRTHLERAQQLIREGRHDEALAMLRALTEDPEAPPSEEALRLRAGTELAVGDLEAAARTTDRAIAAEPGFSNKLQELRARIQAASGQHADLLNTLAGLERRRGLSSREELMRARAHYALENSERGRRILLRLGEASPPDREAIAELARRERHDPAIRSELKRLLERGLAADLSRMSLLGPLVSIHIEEQDDARAIQRITLALTRGADDPQTRASLYLLRAQVQIGRDRLDLAIGDTRRALGLRGQLPGVLPLLVALYYADEAGEAAREEMLADLARRSEGGGMRGGERFLHARLKHLIREQRRHEKLVELALERAAKEGGRPEGAEALAEGMTRLERSLRLSQRALEEQPNASDPLVSREVAGAFRRNAAARFQREVAALGLSGEAVSAALARMVEILGQGESQRAAFEQLLALDVEATEAPRKPASTPSASTPSSDAADS